MLPLDGYRLTATYGEYGLWSSYHTGLDFAAPSGTSLRAVRVLAPRISNLLGCHPRRVNSSCGLTADATKGFNRLC